MVSTKKRLGRQLVSDVRRAVSKRERQERLDRLEMEAKAAKKFRDATLKLGKRKPKLKIRKGRL